MKRFFNVRKGIAVILAVIVALSSFTIGVSAVTATPDEAEVTSPRVNAQIKKGTKLSTGASGGYNVNDTSSWKLWWNKDLKYTNAVTGKSETLYANQYINYHTVNKKGSSTKTTVWCIQPYQCIYNDGNYFLTSDKGNKSYINALKKKGNIKKAVAGTIAFGKPMGANKNNAYYYAVQLLSWEFVMNVRSATEFTINNGKTSLLKYVKCETTKKKNDLSDAYDYIVKMLKTYKDFPTSEKLCTSISKAKSAKVSNKLSLKPSGSKYTVSAQITGLNKYDDLTYAVVNEDDKKTSKDVKVSVKDNKLTVTSSENLDNKNYFVRITRDIEVENTTKDTVLQNVSANSQTISAGMSFTAEPTTKYIAILPYIKPESASLIIHKNISEKSGSTSYDGDYSGWYFLYKNITKNTSQILVTDADGETAPVEKIPLNSKVEVTELGRKITASDNKADFKDIQTVSGVTYGMPKDFTNKTLKYTKTITSSEDIPVEWENEYSKPFPIKIVKSVDDNTSVAGYYFLVYNAPLSEPQAIVNPKIVGPTNADGEVEFNVDNAVSSVICVIELGFLKNGYPLPPSITNSQILNSSELQKIKDRFEIPSRYNVQTGDYAVSFVQDSLAFSISKRNLSDGSKTIYFDNTTSGYLKIHKQDSITKKPLANVTYGVYYQTQPNIDDTDYSQVTGDGTDDNSDSASDIEGDSDAEGDTDSSTPANLVDILTTDGEGNAMSKLLPTGKYYVQEISCDEYHALDTTKYDVEITPGSNTEISAITRTFEDKPSIVKIEKIEESGTKTNGQRLAVNLQIFEKPASGSVDYNSTPVKEITTKVDGYVELIGELKIGKTYILHEPASSVPQGYTQAPDVEFTVGSDETKAVVTMSDKPTYIRLNKLEVSSLSSNGKQLAGATIAIYEKPQSGTIDYKTAKAVYEFKTTDKAENIIGLLKAGKTYIAHEKSCPDGYCLADDVEFTVSTDGKIDDVTMKDKTTKIEIQKLSKKDNKCLAGVTLQIRNMGNEPVKVKDYNGNIVDHWVTTDKPLVIEGMLQAGNTYQLVELSTLPGYVTAEPVIFTVNKNDKVKIVTMYNDTTKYEFSKRKLTGTEEVPGCHMSIREKGKDTNIREWISTDEPYRLEGVLVAGKTYILTEINPADGLTTAESIEFRVGYNSELHTIVMKDDVTKIEFNKIAGDTNKPLANCVLSLTDSNGKEVKRWTTTDKAYRLDGVLAVGKTYTLTEISAAEDYMKAEPVTFTVRDTNEVQTVTMIDKKYAHPDLPVTGGNGLIPFIFAVIGISAFAGAFIVFVIKKKRTDKEN